MTTRRSISKSESSVKRVSLTPNKATKRVIAPYVKIVRKGQKAFENVEEGKHYVYALHKKPSVLLKDLTTFLSDSVDLPSLLYDTFDVLKSISKSSGGSLYFVDFGLDEIHLSQKNVPGDRNKVRWKIQQGTTIAAYVAFKKEYVLIEEMLSDERFPEGLGYKDESVKSVLSVPVVTPDGDCFAVIELYRDNSEQPFDKEILKTVVIITGWMGAAVHQNQQRIALQKQQELNNYLLYLTQCYFADAVHIEKMVTEIVKFAKMSLSAERGSMYVLDKESDDLVADLFEEGIDEPDLHKKNVKVRIGKDRALISYVARTGITVNIKDAYNDPRFGREMDQKTGLITRSLLCMPVRSLEETLGVVQVCNKMGGGCFTKADEELFGTFSIYCALALHYYNLRNKVDKTVKLNKQHLKLMTRQQEPCVHDMTAFSKNPFIPIPEDFATFGWYISPDAEHLLPHYALHMISDIVGRENLVMENLYQFILTAKKNYQFIAYHNFEHGFNVCHCIYNLLSRNLNRFSTIECKAMIVAALCHDVDHPGFTNNFLVMSRDNLAQLYEESVLENHHYRTTLVMLNHCNVYSNINENTFKQISKEIKEAIIATDLALYFRFRVRLLQVCNDNSLEFGNSTHRSLVKAIMMTTADLSGQCKPFNIAKRITENVYREFYMQGDLEKNMGLTPLSMMDREKHHMIPEDQVQFLSVIVLPCLDLIRQVLPNTSPLYDLASTVRSSWYSVIELRNSTGKPWQEVVSQIGVETLN